MGIAARFEEIRDRISKATKRVGREPGSVTLVGVTKTRPASVVTEAAQAGLTDVGENKVQETETKKPDVESGSVRWHLIGHLQKNKAKKAVELFDVIHTVDSVSIGERIDRLAAEAGKTQSVMVQVDLAGEETKFGLPEAELFDALDALARCAHLQVDGLMLLPPYFDEPDEVRPYFRRLRELSEESRARGVLRGSELSMGMSHDFEVAIEEGATLVRVGNAIFGPRPAKVAVGEPE